MPPRQVPPIYLAIEAGDTATVRRLLQDGADPYAIPSPEEYKRLGPSVRSLIEPPWIKAIVTGNQEMVQAFLDFGCDPNAPIRFMEKVIRELHPGMQGSSVLPTKGFEIPEVFEWEERFCLPIGCAIEAVTCGKCGLDFIQFFIDKGIDPNRNDETFYSPLEEALISERLDLAELLLQTGANPGLGSHSLQCALHVAGHGEDPGPLKEIVVLLLNYGADANDRGEEGWTPLHCAASYGYTDIAELLLEYGADIHVQNDAGETALALARKNEYDATAELLLSRGAQ